MALTLKGEIHLNWENWRAHAEQVALAGMNMAKRHGQSVVVSFSVPCTATPFAMAALAGRTRFASRWFFRDGVSGDTLLGLGSAAERNVEGENRFRVVKELIVNAGERTLSDGNLGPVWFCGFSFVSKGHASPWRTWPDAKLTLPQVLIRRQRDGQTTLSIHWVVDAQDTVETILPRLEDVLHEAVDWPSTTGDAKNVSSSNNAGDASLEWRHHRPERSLARSRWQQRVEHVARAAKQGEFGKVVLARTETIPAVASTTEALWYLMERYPESCVFLVTHDDGQVIGATPETLVRVHGDEARVDCLAGTAPRGQTNAEDDWLGSELLASAKNLGEHQFVVDWVMSTLSDLVPDVSALSPQGTPVLRKLHNVQHLWTPLSGKVAPGVHPLDIAARLHPTPAVAGVPRGVALDVIEREEGFDRGWYAGTLGWVDEKGDGTFVVALRCALVKGSIATLFTGAGIVGDSDAQAEWRETELKLDPMRRALGSVDAKSNRNRD